MDNIFTVIGGVNIGYPKQIEINGAIATNWDSTGFTFTLNNLLPLTGQTSTFNYTITYAVYENNVYIKDTVQVINNYKVLISPGAVNAEMLDVKRWDRDLNFRFNNQNIKIANETMPQLEIRLAWHGGDAQYTYTNVQADITHTQGTAKDREVFTLTGQTGYFSLPFARAIDTTPTPGNQILEHHAYDTLVATFRNTENPQLPFDTQEIKIPFVEGSAIENSKGTKNKPGFRFKRSATGRRLLYVNDLPVSGIVSIYRVDGKKVYQHGVNRGDSYLVLPESLSQAVYLIKIKYSNTVLKRKLIIH
jgi:hypothetical protein